MKESEIRDFFFEALPSYGLKHGKKELSVAGLRVDIFAIDSRHAPFIIEFKKSKNRHIVGQAAQYLSLVPTYKEQIEKDLNFYDIRWDSLKVLCIAPDFVQRDFEAAENDPLKGRVHFYEYKTVENTRNRVFSLNIKYLGPEESGPLTIPDRLVDKFDIKSITTEFYKISKKEARREYYSLKILPLLQEICNGLKDFEKIGFYPHISYWNHSFIIRLGSDKKMSHRASIGLNFSDVISYGFDITHSADEGRQLLQKLTDQATRADFIKTTLSLNSYSLYIPNTGILVEVPVELINEKGLDILLAAYKPEKSRDSYFYIQKVYDNESLSVDDAIKLIKTEYEKFKYIFDLILNRLP
jgi:hypothetical protein